MKITKEMLEKIAQVLEFKGPLHELDNLPEMALRSFRKDYLEKRFSKEFMAKIHDRSDAMHCQVYDYILNGGDPFAIIDHIIKVNTDLCEQYRKMIEQMPAPPIMTFPKNIL